MNCPKCHAPINEGDKFCQTCGSTVPQETNNQQQPVQPEVNNETQNQNINMNQGYNNQPMSNMNQPMDQNINMVPPVQNQPQPMNMNTNNYNPVPQQPMQPVNNAIPQESKKNNTVVYVLMAVVLVLLAVVVFLLVTSGKDEKEPKNKEDDNNTVEENNKDKEKDDADEEEVIASNYTKSNVNEYTFELPKGYSAGYYGNHVVFYDNDMTDVEGYVFSTNMAYSNIDKETTKANLQATGLTNVSYSERKVNNKNMLIFVGNYQGYDVEIIYVEYSYAKLVAAEVYYKTSTNINSDVYDILGRVVVDDSAFSSNTSIRIPNLDTTPATN